MDFGQFLPRFVQPGIEVNPFPDQQQQQYGNGQPFEPPESPGAFPILRCFACPGHSRRIRCITVGSHEPSLMDAGGLPPGPAAGSHGSACYVRSTSSAVGSDSTAVAAGTVLVSATESLGQDNLVLRRRPRNCTSSPAVQFRCSLSSAK